MDRLEGILSTLSHLNLQDQVVDKQEHVEGYGGSCDVFSAWSRKHNKGVAIKRIRSHLRNDPLLAKVIVLIILSENMFMNFTLSLPIPIPRTRHSETGERNTHLGRAQSHQCPPAPRFPYRGSQPTAFLDLRVDDKRHSVPFHEDISTRRRYHLHYRLSLTPFHFRVH